MKRLFSYFKICLILVCLYHKASAQTLTLNTTSTPACNHDGTASISVSGGTAPYTYYWYSSGTINNTTSTITGLAGGWYYVYVYDSGGNSAYTSVYVDPPFILSGSATAENCNNQDGSATINVTGGTSPFSYQWSNGQITQTATGLSSGNYNVTVTDANGCNFSSSEDSTNNSLYVYNNSPVTVSVTSTNTTCANNGTATANPTGGVGPYSFYWMTNPVQTTQTATNLPSNYYEVRVTDSNGCMTSSWVYIGQDPSLINVYITNTDENCLASDGTATVYPSGGQSPYSYLWDNGQTTQTATGLNSGWHGVTITDAQGCSTNSATTVSNTSPILLSFSTTNSSCHGADGTITVSASGGTSPYTYLWSNGQTGQVATGLKAGWYAVTATDANGCKKEKYAYVWEDQNCYVFISGYVYEDKNSNCIKEITEKGLFGSIVTLTSNAGNIVGYYYTDISGYYGFTVDPGMYTITVTPMNYWILKCPVSGTYSVTLNTPGTSSTVNDFGFEAIPGKQDLMVYFCTDRACTGFDHHYYIRCFNVGTIPMMADVKAVLDQGLTYLNSAPLALTFTPNEATWNFNMDYMTDQSIAVTTHVPLTINQGDMLSDTVMISPVNGDLTAANNIYYYNQIISCAYDPNEMIVSPQGQTPSGNISVNDSTLYYTVRFQNTGTDTAYTIVIRDTIDSNLDIRTFHEGAASHNNTVSIEGNNVLVFTFNNILLPDSNINESGSHGVVSFSIKQKKNLAVGTEIRNKAGIYFDYNSPVITNTTLNTIVAPLGVKEDKENDISVYPNPTGGVVTLGFDSFFTGNISVTDVLGKTVLNQNASGNKLLLDLSQFKNGIYILNAKDGNKTIQKKIAVLH